jgi:hypothetical protein
MLPYDKQFLKNLKNFTTSKHDETIDRLFYSLAPSLWNTVTVTSRCGMLTMTVDSLEMKNPINNEIRKTVDNRKLFLFSVTLKIHASAQGEILSAD